MTEKSKLLKSLGFIVLTLVLFSLFVVGIQSCGNHGPSIQEFTQELKNEGFKTEVKPDPYAGMLKAEYGKRVFLLENGTRSRLEIYRFDLSSPSAKESIQTIATDGMNGKQAIRNGPLLLFDKKSHPRWKEIRKIFNSL